MRVPPKTAKALAIVQGITALVAVGALIVSLVNVTGRIDSIVSQRQHSRHDICETLRALVFAATPPKQMHNPKLHKFLVQTGLDNCTTFASNSS